MSATGAEVTMVTGTAEAFISTVGVSCGQTMKPAPTAATCRAAEAINAGVRLAERTRSMAR